MNQIMSQVFQMLEIKKALQDKILIQLELTDLQSVVYLKNALINNYEVVQMQLQSQSGELGSVLPDDQQMILTQLNDLKNENPNASSAELTKLWKQKFAEELIAKQSAPGGQTSGQTSGQTAGQTAGKTAGKTSGQTTE